MRSQDLDARFNGSSQLLAVADRERVREGCRLLAHGLNEVLVDGREKDLALTHLENVMFWAHASIHRAEHVDVLPG